MIKLFVSRAFVKTKKFEFKESDSLKEIERQIFSKFENPDHFEFYLHIDNKKNTLIEYKDLKKNLKDGNVIYAEQRPLNFSGGGNTRETAFARAASIQRFNNSLLDFIGIGTNDSRQRRAIALNTIADKNFNAQGLLYGLSLNESLNQIDILQDKLNKASKVVSGAATVKEIFGLFRTKGVGRLHNKSTKLISTRERKAGDRITQLNTNIKRTFEDTFLIGAGDYDIHYVDIAGSGQDVTFGDDSLTDSLFQNTYKATYEKLTPLATVAFNIQRNQDFVLTDLDVNNLIPSNTILTNFGLDTLNEVYKAVDSVGLKFSETISNSTARFDFFETDWLLSVKEKSNQINEDKWSKHYYEQLTQYSYPSEAILDYILGIGYEIVADNTQSSGAIDLLDPEQNFNIVLDNATNSYKSASLISAELGENEIGQISGSYFLNQVTPAGIYFKLRSDKDVYLPRTSVASGASAREKEKREALERGASGKQGGFFYSIRYDAPDPNTDIGDLYRISIDGTATFIGSLGVIGQFSALAWDGSNLYSINTTTNSLYTLNIDNGSATLIGTAGSLDYTNWSGLTSVNGQLVGLGSSVLYDIDKSNGTSSNPRNISSEISSLDYDGTNYYSIFNDGDHELCRLDITLGTATVVDSNAPYLNSFFISSVGETLYGISAYNTNLYTINKSTGVESLIANVESGSNYFLSLTYVPAQTPVTPPSPSPDTNPAVPPSLSTNAPSTLPSIVNLPRTISGAEICSENDLPFSFEVSSATVSDNFIWVKFSSFSYIPQQLRGQIFKYNLNDTTAVPPVTSSLASIQEGNTNIGLGTSGIFYYNSKLLSLTYSFFNGSTIVFEMDPDTFVIDSSRQSTFTGIPQLNWQTEITTDGVDVVFNHNVTTADSNTCYVYVLNYTQTGQFTRKSSSDFNFNAREVFSDTALNSRVRTMFFTETGKLGFMARSSNKVVFFTRGSDGTYSRDSSSDINLPTNNVLQLCGFYKDDKIYSVDFTSPSTFSTARAFCLNYLPIPDQSLNQTDEDFPPFDDITSTVSGTDNFWTVNTGANELRRIELDSSPSGVGEVPFTNIATTEITSPEAIAYVRGEVLVYNGSNIKSYIASNLVENTSRSTDVTGLTGTVQSMTADSTHIAILTKGASGAYNVYFWNYTQSGRFTRNASADFSFNESLLGTVASGNEIKGIFFAKGSSNTLTFTSTRTNKILCYTRVSAYSYRRDVNKEVPISVNFASFANDVYTASTYSRGYFVLGRPSSDATKWRLIFFDYSVTFNFNYNTEVDALDPEDQVTLPPPDKDPVKFEKLAVSERTYTKATGNARSIWALRGSRTIDLLNYDLESIEDDVIEVSHPYARDSNGDPYLLDVKGLDLHNNVLVVLASNSISRFQTILFYDTENSYNLLDYIELDNIDGEESLRKKTPPPSTKTNNKLKSSGSKNKTTKLRPSGASGNFFGLLAAIVGTIIVGTVGYMINRSLTDKKSNGRRANDRSDFIEEQEEDFNRIEEEQADSDGFVVNVRYFTDITFNGKFILIHTKRSIFIIDYEDKAFYKQRALFGSALGFSFEGIFYHYNSGPTQKTLKARRIDALKMIVDTPSNDVDFTSDLKAINSAFPRNENAFYLLGENNSGDTVFQKIDVTQTITGPLIELTGEARPLPEVTLDDPTDVPQPPPELEFTDSPFDITFNSIKSDSSSSIPSISFIKGDFVFTLDDIRSVTNGNTRQLSQVTTYDFKARNKSTKARTPAEDFSITTSDLSSLSSGVTDFNGVTNNFASGTESLSELVKVLVKGDLFYLVMKTSTGKTARTLYAFDDTGSRSATDDIALSAFNPITKTAKSGRTFSERKMKLDQAELIGDLLLVPYLQAYTATDGQRDEFYMVIAFDTAGSLVSYKVFDVGNFSNTSITEFTRQGMNFNFNDLTGAFTDGTDYFLKDNFSTPKRYRAYSPVIETEVSVRSFGLPTIPVNTGQTAGLYVVSDGTYVWFTGRRRTLYAFNLLSPTAVPSPSSNVDLAYKTSKDITFDETGEVATTNGLKFTFRDGENVYTESSALTARAISDTANITFACRSKSTGARLQSNDITITKSSLTSLMTKTSFTGSDVAVNAVKNVFINGSYIYLYFDVAVGGSEGNEGVPDDDVSGKTEAGSTYKLFAFDKSTGSRSSTNDISLSSFATISKTVPSGRTLQRKSAYLKDTVFFNNKAYILCDQEYASASDSTDITRFDFLIPYSLTGTATVADAIDVRRLSITSSTSELEKGINLAEDTNYRSLWTDNTDLYIRGTGYEGHEAFYPYNPTSKLLVNEKIIGVPSDTILGNDTTGVDRASFNASDGTIVWFNGKNDTLFAYELAKAYVNFNNNYYIDLHLETAADTESVKLDIPYRTNFYFNDINLNKIVNVSLDYTFNVPTIKIVFRLTQEQYKTLGSASRIFIRETTGEFVFFQTKARTVYVPKRSFAQKYVDSGGQWSLVAPKNNSKMPVYVFEFEGANKTGIKGRNGADLILRDELTLASQRSTSYYMVAYPRVEDITGDNVPEGLNDLALTFTSETFDNSTITKLNCYRHTYADFNPNETKTLTLGATLAQGDSITFDRPTPSGSLVSASNVTLNNNLSGMAISSTDIFGSSSSNNTVYKYGLTGGASASSATVTGVTNLRSLCLLSDELLVLSQSDIHVLDEDDLSETSSRKTSLSSLTLPSSNDNCIETDGTIVYISYNMTVNSVARCFVKAFDYTSSGAFQRNTTFDFDFAINDEFGSSTDVNVMLWINGSLHFINKTKDKSIAFEKEASGFTRRIFYDMTLPTTTGTLTSAFYRNNNLYLGITSGSNTVATAVDASVLEGVWQVGDNPVSVYPERVFFSYAQNVSTTTTSLTTRTKITYIVNQYIRTLRPHIDDSSEEEKKKQERFDKENDFVVENIQNYIRALDTTLSFYVSRKIYDPIGDRFIESSNPANICLHLLSELYDSLDLPITFTDFVDTQSFIDFRTWCFDSANEFEFHGEFNSPTTYLDALQIVANAGRGTVLFGFGKISVHIDRSQTNVSQHFHAGNISSISIQKTFRKVPAILEAIFNDKGKGYEKNTLSVRTDPTDTTGNSKQTINVQGIVESDKVTDRLNFEIKKLNNQPEIYTITVDLAAVRCEVGDLVGVNYEMLQASQFTGTVRKQNLSNNLVASVLINQDTAPELDPTKMYSFVVLNNDGTTLSIPVTSISDEKEPDSLTSELASDKKAFERKLRDSSMNTANRGQTFKKITFSSPANPTQVPVGARFIFGENTNVFKKALVLSIQSDSNLLGTVTLQEYIPAWYS